MQSDYDVLIVGSGLAGACLALALRSTGLQVGVIEALAPSERQNAPAGDRALALSKGSMRVLEQLDLWTGVADQATPIQHIHVSDRGHFGKARLSAQKEGVDALGYIILARQLEPHVATVLAESPADLICPARVMALASGPERVSVSIKHGQDSRMLTTRLLVAADGGASTVRKLLEIGQKTRDYQQTAIVTVVRAELNHHCTAYERFTTSGPLALLPMPDRQCAVVWTLSSEQAEATLALDETVFIERLQDCFGHRLGQLTLTAPRRAFPLHLVQAERMTAGRVVLIGNAAHQLHPVAGQGFNLGLRDVAVLAEQLSTADQRGEDPGDADALARYARLRQRDHAAVIGFTDHVVRIFSNAWKPLAAARTAGLLTLDHFPAGKHRLTRYAMGLAGRQPHLR